MKKPIYLLMPLMCISFLASCGKVEPEPPKTYTITFKNDNEEDKKIENIEEGSIVTENIPVPSQREGSTFIGWCTDTESKYIFDFSKVKIFQDYTLYSGWKENEPEPVIHKLSFSGEHLTLKDLEGTTITEKEYEEGTTVRLIVTPENQYIIPKKEKLELINGMGEDYDPALYIYDQTTGVLMITINDDVTITGETYNPHVENAEELEQIIAPIVEGKENYTAHFVDGFGLPIYDIQVSNNIIHLKGYNEYDNWFTYDNDVGGADSQSNIDVYAEIVDGPDGEKEYWCYQPYGQMHDDSARGLPFSGRGYLDDLWYKEDIEGDEIIKLLEPIGSLEYLYLAVQEKGFESLLFIDDHYEISFPLYGALSINCKAYFSNKKIVKYYCNMSGFYTSNMTFTYDDPSIVLPTVTETYNPNVSESEWNDITKNILDKGPISFNLSNDNGAIAHIGFDKHYLNTSQCMEPGISTREAYFLEYDNDDFNHDYCYYGTYSNTTLMQGTTPTVKTEFTEEKTFDSLWAEKVEAPLNLAIKFLNGKYSSFEQQTDEKGITYYYCESLTVEIMEGLTFEYSDIKVIFMNKHLCSISFTVYGTQHYVPISYKDVKVLPPLYN